MEAGLICRAVQTERFRCDLGRFRLGAPIANARTEPAGAVRRSASSNNTDGISRQGDPPCRSSSFGVLHLDFPDNREWNREFLEISPDVSSWAVLRAGHEADSTACSQFPVPSETGNFIALNREFIGRNREFPTFGVMASTYA